MAAPAAGAAAAGGAGKGAGGAAGGLGRGGPGAAARLRPGNPPGGDEQQEQERQQRTRRVRRAAALVGFLALTLVLLLGVVLISLFTRSAAIGAQNAGWGYPTGSGVPEVYWPIYLIAADGYQLSPYLLASIHKQETNFSRHPRTKGGLNGFGCCGGPMQFKPSTWASYEDAFLKVEDRRPASYPLHRRDLESCRGIAAGSGCMYDDFDAIAGAAMKLSADGADLDLDSAGTRSGVCAYIGSCAEVDRCTGSVNQYCEVISRAREWQRLGARTTPVAIPGAQARLLPNGLAAPPAAAPEAVKQMIRAANAISDKPYRLVHYPTHIGNPTYDCSSSTSHVLWAGGAFGTAPMCSAGFASYGKAGPGAWVTVYSRGPCTGQGHVFVVIAGLRFDTSTTADAGPNAGDSGPRWRTPRSDLASFVARHPSGL